MTMGVTGVRGTKMGYDRVLAVPHVFITVVIPTLVYLQRPVKQPIHRTFELFSSSVERGD